MGGDSARGRPRDPRIDGLVLAATRDLLAQRGFAETTIQAVARQTGVGASTIYRRWPSRIELIESAVFPGLGVLDIAPTGDVRADLRRFVVAYRELFESPAARAGVPGLLAAYQAEPERHGTLVARVGQDVRPAFQATLAAAAPGTVDPAVDPDTVMDVLIGAAVYDAFIRPFTGRAAGAAADRAAQDDRVCDLLMRALRPDDGDRAPAG
ncbi:TetR/AcrR family transcriptional regulator [Frankia sp. CNm7]|uniref:TetR/AcrR family transcriptional regulator n=1 Tax=Frankia nepalensis TaxID=1836974 RepID=A0A937RNJ1_9ACTN|nr:TetR/AcrR family transcriptional regulator [Frankia nepalensis]MBL7502036.1 TetR/AcrR family transcriptional regulator [Frankia nepalensis]MBL7511942.1 TetR/AcrR family transcriptional regulator [Frankia nepalensis]MBL7524285.1 TetR/AcrR family transcriptional regulator [Frankia nepalensis]MBL7630534.1 TetR/AcrR family transcriptional regulator [Frankia nepalensis]